MRVYIDTPLIGCTPLGCNVRPLGLRRDPAVHIPNVLQLTPHFEVHAILATSVAAS